MIADPYRVLGIDENADEAAIKRAYREMSKKYHPDANPDNPEAAEEKFKEVQEAYKQILDAKQRGTSAYGRDPRSAYQQGTGQSSQYGGRGYAEYGGYYGGAFSDFFEQWQRYSEEQRARQTAGESNEMTAARNYINAGHYAEALNALRGVSEDRRNARWYYLHAVANAYMGNNIAAMDSAKRACDMEPDNSEYRMLLQQLQSGGRYYTQRGADYGGFGGSGSSGWCLSLCALNLLCNLCGGGGFFCI